MRTADILRPLRLTPALWHGDDERDVISGLRQTDAQQPDMFFVCPVRCCCWPFMPSVALSHSGFANRRNFVNFHAGNAVISRSGVLASRFEYEWYGPWEKVVGKFHIRKGEKGEYRVPGWTLADEAGIGIIIRATLKGEDQPRELDLLLAQARTRNSTLWADDPRQQLAYLAVKRWARLFCPDVILGVYTPDELDDRREEREVNPAPVQHISLTEITDDNLSTTQNAQQSSVNIDTLADEYRKRIDSAETLDDATTVGNDINASKSVLGAALHTELKNKATRRYHFVNAKNKVDTAIKALPKPGVEGAGEHFEEVEKMLLAAKRHLGDELHDKYRITLDDMKPEYVA